MPFPLPAPDAVLVTLLAHERSLIARDLARSLGFAKSKVSRVLKKLVDGGLLARNPAAHDARVQVLTFTARGEAVRAQLVQANTAIARLVLAQFDDTTQERFALLFGKLADGFEAPDDRALPGEHPLVRHQRRMAKITGMVSDHYMDTKFDLVSYQILFELARNNTPVRFRQIATLIPADPPQMSRQLDAFVADRWVTKGVLSSDRRAAPLRLTSRGREEFLNAHRLCALRYQSALSKMPRADVTTLMDMLEQIVSEPLPGTSTERLAVRKADDEVSRKRARKLLVEYLVAAEQHSELESDLLPVTRQLFLVERGHELVALLELSPQGDFTEISNIAFAREFRSEEQQALVLKLLFREIVGHISNPSLMLRGGLLSDRVKLLIGVHQSPPGKWKMTLTEALH